MGDLNDDLILEVMSRLSLKEVIRCKILNKNFYSYISNQNFQHKHFVQSRHKVSNLVISSYSSSQMVYQLQLDPPYPLRYVHQNDVIEPVYCSIIASCSGLILMYSVGYGTYCVFNPITKEFQLVPAGKYNRSAGLAVDSNTRSYSFRIIDVGVRRHETCSEKCIFEFVTFVVGSSQWEVTHQEELVSKSVWLDRKTQAVYLHGSLHWLLKCGDILIFDLEKCRARIIQGPGEKNSAVGWFGGEGSLVFCKLLKSEIVIYVYEHKTWQIRHKISSISRTGECYCKSGIQNLMFDGERLFILLRRTARDVGEIYMHNILTKSWEKIKMSSWILGYIQVFVPFVPTLAKLYSGFYLHNQIALEKLPYQIRVTIIVLYKLLSCRSSSLLALLLRSTTKQHCCFQVS